MPRRPSSFPPPRLLDPESRDALARAIANGERVHLYLRGNPARGTSGATLIGVPARASPSREGRPRIAIATKDGATQQLVLVEQIERVEVERR